MTVDARCKLDMMGYIRAVHSIPHLPREMAESVLRPPVSSEAEGVPRSWAPMRTFLATTCIQVGHKASAQDPRTVQESVQIPLPL